MVPFACLPLLSLATCAWAEQPRVHLLAKPATCSPRKNPLTVVPFGESARVEGAGFPVQPKPRPERADPWKPRPIKADSDVSFTKAPPRRGGMDKLRHHPQLGVLGVRRVCEVLRQFVLCWSLELFGGLEKKRNCNRHLEARILSQTRIV